MDERTRVLILGSFPGDESLRRKQYYANPRNQFWPVIGAVIAEDDFHYLPYEERLSKLLDHGIGLWDVYASCERQGSLDSRIRSPVENDLAVLRTAPGLKLICFNGKKSGSCSDIYRTEGYATLVLPSTSPANTIPFDDKFDAWKRIAKYL
jgi:hypoxanthine-DNA glycosylase